MSEKLYCYEQGYCRGEPFGTKKALGTDLVLLVMVKALEVKDDDELEEFVDEQARGKGHEVQNILWTLCIGESWMGIGDEGRQEGLKERIEKVTKGESFAIECEESTWGFGLSPQEAMIAFARANDDLGDSWD